MKLDKAAILIKKAALEFDKVSNTALSEYDLTNAQYKVIKYLIVTSDRGIRLADLEKYFSMAHPTAIGIVQNLEKKGLVTYAPNPNDARSRFIVPTAQAMERREEWEAVGAKMEKELTSAMTEQERKQLVSLLRKMLRISEDE